MSVASAVLERFSVTRYAQLANHALRTSTFDGGRIEPIWPADAANPQRRPGAVAPDVSMLAVVWASPLA